MILISTSFAVPLDMDGTLWYNDYSDIDIENLTLAEQDHED